MTVLRVLHVDDELDVRELVEIPLALDPDLIVRIANPARSNYPAPN